jgi:hypothetical protein
MIMRIVIPLLLLPLVVLAFPLLFALAWLREAVSDRAAARSPSQLLMPRSLTLPRH